MQYSFRRILCSFVLVNSGFIRRLRLSTFIVIASSVIILIATRTALTGIP